mgnify:CR=1 FL=1
MSWIFQISAAERSAGRLSASSAASVAHALSEHGAVLLRGVYATEFVDAMKHDFDAQWGSFSSNEMREKARLAKQNPIYDRRALKLSPAEVEEKLAGQLELEDVESDPLVAEIFEKVKARRSEYLPAEDTVSTISDDATVEKRHGAGQTQGAAPEIVSVIADRVTVEECREAGPAYVGNCFWERIGIDDVLKEAGLSAKARLLTRVMTLNRLVCPRSEHAMPGWIGTSAAGDLIGADLAGLNDDALYRNLDLLHACRDQIEKGLTARERDLFNLDASVFFYDLTSTYFEGQCARNPKAERGYSRDRRFDCKQVVLGMVVNRDGFACAHEVFEGGRQDAKSLNNMLDILEKRTGRLKGSTIVVDRGMALDENLAAIRGRECHYIVASRQAERNAWLEEFESGDWQEVK